MKTDSVTPGKIDRTAREPGWKQADNDFSVDKAISSLSAYCDQLIQRFRTEMIHPADNAADLVPVQTVFSASCLKPADAEIMENVVGLIKSFIPTGWEKIKVEITDGCISLFGQVEWNFVNEPFINSIKELEGVT